MKGTKHLDDLPKFDPKKHEENRIKNIEFCKCRNDLKNWQHHKQYCPIWKNGRIRELEITIKNLQKSFEYYSYVEKPKARDEFDEYDEMMSPIWVKSKQMLKQ